MMKKLSAIAVFMCLILAAVNAFSMGSMPPAPQDDPDLQNPPGECSASKVPVVFVHGLYGSGFLWNTAINFLEDQGYDRDLMVNETMPVANTTLCSSEHGEIIAEWIDDVLAENPQFTQIDLVGHSRGGGDIMTGLWSGAIDHRKVRNVVTLSGANRACGGIPRDETPGDIFYSVYYSSADTLVRYSTTHIDGAYEENLETLSHSTMITDSKALNAILEGLQASGCDWMK